RDQPVMRLQIDEQRIVATFEHPFHVEARGWVAASALQPGDKVWTDAGSQRLAIVHEAYNMDERASVYNFEVADAHTYYITERKLLVHNMSALATGAMARDRAAQLSVKEFA